MTNDLNYPSFQNTNLMWHEPDFFQLVEEFRHFVMNTSLFWSLRHYLNSLVCNLQGANSLVRLNVEKDLNSVINKRCFPKRTRDLKLYLKCKLIYFKWVVLKCAVVLSANYHFWFPILSYAKMNAQRQIQISILKSIYLVWIN